MDKNEMLLISNGYGEDIIGANILKELLKRSKNINVKVLPIVGAGKAYNSLPVKIIGPGKVLPSGGFARNSIKNFFDDVKGGLFNLTFSQIKTLKRESNNVEAVIVVGDVYILLLAGLFVKKETIFLPTAKSEYISGHYWVEKKLINKYADIVFPRDKKTTDVLKDANINAVYAGNAMMDCFQVKNVDFKLDKTKNTVGVLPGSREEAYSNIKQILKVIEEMEKQSVDTFNFLFAMASNLKLQKIIKICEENRCMAVDTNNKNEDEVFTMKSPGGSIIKIIYHHFGDVLDQADIFIGLAGTANEQAVGMGKPLVAFPGTGSQFTKKFAQAQKLLLGDSMELIDGDIDQIAMAIIDILNNSQRYDKMSKIGRERMGESGGIACMVDLLIKQLN